ncbi:hypothetical protein Tco_1056631 [Tanacetum coccineum]|uniref:Uncharacterized protein n=1 Tax=Tanacetum coccineum TaxID=301880 RepID=A0ABQ5H489_9ASTR
MEILLEPTSNKLMVERFNTSVGNPVKEILRKLNLPDHRILKYGGEDMALPPSDQRHQYLRSGQPDPTDTPRYEGLHYTNADIADFKMRLARIYRREVHRVQVFNFRGLPDLIVEGLSTRMLMEHMDAQRFGEAVLDLDTVGALLFQLGGVRRRMSWREFILALGLHLAKEMQTAGFGLYWAESARRIPDKGELSDYWIRISSVGDFLGMDVGSVNVPYLLARYLRLFASRRKQGAMISRGGVDEEALVAPGGGDEDDEIPQAMPSPPRTQGERIAQLEEVGNVIGRVPETHQTEDRRCQHFHTPAAAKPMIPLSLIFCLYPLIKPGSKFNTIVREFVMEPSTLSKSRAELRRESDFKCVKAEGKKSNLKTS